MPICDRIIVLPCIINLPISLGEECEIFQQESRLKWWQSNTYHAVGFKN